MKRTLLAAALLSGLALAQTASPTSPLLTEGQRQLSLMQTSSYQHKTDVDESVGKFNYDCSGFLVYALKNVSRAALAELPVSKRSSGRPLAQDFYTLFSGLNTKSAHWQRVRKAIHLKPGDIVSWLRPPDNDSNNTGHVMLVRAPAVRNPQDAREVLVQVLDSTTSPHAQDSRAPGQNGLGTGTIGLMVDTAGEPVAYRWQGGVSKVEEVTPIALGRLLERGAGSN